MSSTNSVSKHVTGVSSEENALRRELEELRKSFDEEKRKLENALYQKSRDFEKLTEENYNLKMECNRLTISTMKERLRLKRLYGAFLQQEEEAKQEPEKHALTVTAPVKAANDAIMKEEYTETPNNIVRKKQSYKAKDEHRDMPVLEAMPEVKKRDAGTISQKKKQEPNGEPAKKKKKREDGDAKTCSTEPRRHNVRDGSGRFTRKEDSVQKDI